MSERRAHAVNRRASAHEDGFARKGLPAPEIQPEFLFDLPELRYPERLNAAVELIDRHVMAGRGGRVAIRNGQGRWTYAELKECSDRIASLLVHEEGLVAGNRVLLRGPNGMMLFAAWLGILKAGGIVVATMPVLRSGEIATILARARISHAIVDERHLEDFEAAAARTGLAASVMTYAGDFGTGRMEERLPSAPLPFRPVATFRDDVALIAFTSGTTGEPKGCIQYHRDILAVADSFSRHVVAPRPDDVFCTSAPIAFTFGLGATLIFPFRVGASALTLEQASPQALVEAVRAHAVTTLFTAPTAYKAILNLLGEQGLPSLHTCVSAGEHLPAATWEAWKSRTGLRIIDGIGATEMMHIFISARGDDIRPGATGKAVPGYRACILDEEDRPQRSGVGRLAVKGPTGCRYLDDPRQRKYVVRGWNVTGDTYRLDDEGYYWYLARSDDMIISSGYNIAAPEVENALYAHPAVQECAVVGVPCEERGQKVKAFVVPGPDRVAGPSLAIELQDHVKASIAPYKYPREVEFVTELPKTATGKLKRFALRQPG